MRTFNAKAFGEKISNFGNESFKVAVAPMIMPEGFTYGSKDEQFNNVLDITNNKVLGVVKKQYNPLQQDVMIDNFMEVAQALNVSSDKVTYHISNDHKKVRLRMELDPIEFKNQAGKKDVTNTFLNLQTGYDGNTSTSLFIETFRLICTNGLKIGRTEFNAKMRNIQSNQGAILDLLASMPQVVKGVNETKEIFEFLNTQKISRKDIYTFLAKLDEKKFGDDAKERNIASFRAIEECIEFELKNTGLTKFGLLNAVTHYSNHFGRNSQTEQGHNVEALYNGAFNTLNNKALEMLLK